MKYQQSGYLERRLLRMIRCLEDRLHCERRRGNRQPDAADKEGERLLNIAAVGLAERLAVYMEEKE